jgi:hypothetical protein
VRCEVYLMWSRVWRGWVRVAGRVSMKRRRVCWCDALPLGGVDTADYDAAAVQRHGAEFVERGGLHA